MREFAQFVETASGRIALEGVDGAAHPPDDFVIGGARFGLQPCLIQRLQQVLGALEKERAQLRPAIVGRVTHEFASVRWYAVPLFSCTMRNLCVKPKRLSACPTKR